MMVSPDVKPFVNLVFLVTYRDRYTIQHNGGNQSGHSLFYLFV
jgi:hypothetical protein